MIAKFTRMCPTCQKLFDIEFTCDHDAKIAELDKEVETYKRSWEINDKLYSESLKKVLESDKQFLGRISELEKEVQEKYENQPYKKLYDDLADRIVNLDETEKAFKKRISELEKMLSNETSRADSLITRQEGLELHIEELERVVGIAEKALKSSHRWIYETSNNLASIFPTERVFEDIGKALAEIEKVMGRKGE